MVFTNPAAAHAPFFIIPPECKVMGYVSSKGLLRLDDVPDRIHMLGRFSKKAVGPPAGPVD